MRILGLLFVLIGLQSAGAQSQGDPSLCQASPRKLPVLWARADLLSWSPHMRGLDYAASESGSALVLGAGQSHEVELDRDTGFRTQLGLLMCSGWGIDFGYTHFGSEGRDATSRPAGTGQLFSTFSHPGGPEEADTASAFTSLDYDVFDLAARFGVIKGCSIGVDFFTGLRWADINHEMRVDYDGRDFVSGVLRNTADVNAFGLRSGVDGRWFMSPRWSGFATTSLAAMYGKFDHYRFESNINGTQIQVDFRDSYTQPVFNIETALGLSYTFNSWRVSGGYELSVWTNLGDSLRFVDDIEEGGFAALPGDLLLEGFFFRTEKTW